LLPAQARRGSHCCHGDATRNVAEGFEVLFPSGTVDVAF
jgi:hypothetical protein